MSVPADNTSSYADLFQTKDKDGNWFTVARKPKIPALKRKIIGTQSLAEAKIKGVAPKAKVWHIFVGKLDPETTEDDLTTLLSDQGITVNDCKLPPKKEQWQHKFSAFRVVFLTSLDVVLLYL